MLRDIIFIDEDLCDGCGACIPSCAEGALAIVDGKARVVADRFCDGLGACLGHCPKGALTVVKKETDPFDEQAAHEHVRAMSQTPPAAPASCQTANVSRSQTGPLPTWPVQLRLVPPTAPFLAGADILLAADCSVAAAPDFHARLKGRVLLMACPKFDDPADMIQRLDAILTAARPNSVEILRMEVPCCRGIVRAFEVAARDRNIPLTVTTLSTAGRVVHEPNLKPMEAVA
ncbi:MAG: 4Fe-4S dicluster domain-containing protein [Deltaproteobacteria bacterium]|nr:4Fe-4S dicluster domain-containing protein [Deltaproteobacteria bacterium]